MKKNAMTVVLSVILSALAAYGIVRTAVRANGSQDVSFSSSDAASFDGARYRTVNLAQTDYPDFTYAAESAVDAVVYVAVTVRQTQNYQIDPFYRFFFGDEAPQSRDRLAQGSGSGVIIRSDGYIVTNNHVVENATEINVTLNNNKTFPAHVIGSDPATDVALIKIDADGLPTIPFANSDNLRLGEWVLAIGSPYDLRSTITAGIVSAKGRAMMGQRSGSELKIESFIQTDAAVNPGNSGGALVNKAGELVGVNTAIISQTGSYSGYSFAVPSNIVRKIVEDLIDFGQVRRVMLGITGGNLTDEIAKELKLSSLNGVYINEVQKGSTADKAGLKKDDVILELGGTKVNNMSALQEKVNSFHPGDKAEIKFVRSGSERTEELVFQEAAGEAKNGTVDEDGAVAFYGAKLAPASKETLSRLGLKKGVEIVSLGSGKMREAGASEGFVIQYVNDQPVENAKQVVDIANKSKRAVFIEGVSASGRASYFGFGKDE